MKKIISLILTFMLAAAVTAVPAGGAEIPDEQTDALYRRFCAYYGYTPHVLDSEHGPVDRFQVRGYSGGYALCYASHCWFITLPAYYHIQIGGYTVAPGSWETPSRPL